MAPGRPVCLVDFDLQKGDFRALLDTPHRRSVVDLVVVSNEISVRHLQETLYTHKDGFRLLLAPEQGEKAEDVDSAVARNVLSAVKARHALTVVDIGAVATEATAIAAEMAGQVLVVTTPDVLALRGVRRMRDLWKRHRRARGRGRQGRAQPRVARGARSSPTWRARSSARRWCTRRSPPTSTRSRPRSTRARRAGWRTTSCAARSRRWRASSTSSRSPTRSRAATTSRAACWPASAASAASRPRSSWACSRCSRSIFLVLWQIALTGYTYIAAGHAAREGARELATDSTRQGRRGWREARKRDWSKEPRTTRSRARTSMGAWRKHARDRAARRRDGLGAPARAAADARACKSPLTVGSTADTVLEDGDAVRPPGHDAAQERLRRGRELELMLRRLITRSAARPRPS